MRIAIEINGVLRNTLDKIEQTYQKYMIDKTEGLEDDESFKYEMVLPVDTFNLRNHFKFQTDEELYSFLYEEFPMEIFGHAQSTEYSTFNDFNEIYLNLRDDHDILIVSDEIGKSKPASLFFISKFGCLVETVKFYCESTINSMWDSIDVLLTANPTLLLNYPKDKVVIKYETLYNQNINVEHTITTLKDLKTKITEIYD
jgi:hypothetical protein